MRPPFAYYGGKTGMARKIVELLPPHRVYIEPFFGSGAVLFAKQPAHHEIINDLDDGIVSFFRCLRDMPDQLERACRLTPYARTEFERAAVPADDDLERARRFWARVNQSFAHTAGAKTGWSITTARNTSPPRSIAGRLARFEALSDRLASVMIERCDAVGLIDRLATADTVVYCDPPYLASTRNGRKDGAEMQDYRLEFTESDHRRLAIALHATPATVVLSGYPSPLYDDLFGDWHVVDFAVTATSSNALTTTRSQRVERIWTNRPPNTLFHQEASA